MAHPLNPPASHWPEGHIFVVGQERSGTSLLYSTLFHHHTLAGFQGETAYFAHFAEKFGNLHNPDNWQRLLAAFIQSPQFTKSRVDPQALADLLAQRPPSYAALFSAWHALHPKAGPGVRVVEKTPYHIFHIRKIRAYYPAAKFIHITRDGRDAAVSSLTKKQASGRFAASERNGQLIKFAVRYRVHEALGQSFQRQFGRANYLRIRYEDLVTEPQATLSRLDEFLHLQSPGLWQALQSQTDSLTGAFRDPNTTFRDDQAFLEENALFRVGSIGRHAQLLTDIELSLFEWLARDTLLAQGYSLHGQPLPPRMRRWAITTLVRSPRLLLWYLWPALAGRYFPGVLGR